MLFPANLSISTAFENTPVPSVFEECLILQNPPWSTSVSVLASHLSLTNLLFIGSILKFCTLAGTAVFPTALNVIVAGDLDGSPIAFKLNTLT